MKPQHLAIRATAAATFIAHVSMLWDRILLKKKPQADIRVKKGLNKLAKAVAFIVYASLDALQFSSKALDAGIAVQHQLWLWNWNVDTIFKSNAKMFALCNSLNCLLQ